MDGELRRATAATANIPLAVAADADRSLLLLARHALGHRRRQRPHRHRRRRASSPSSAVPATGSPTACGRGCRTSTATASHTFETTDLPAGGYEWKVALYEGWDENYGADGIAGGANIAFTVAAAGDRVTFRWDEATNVPTVEVASGSGLEDGDEELVTAPVRTPTTDEVVYFVMTDRFADGQPDNNRAGSASDDRLVHGFDPTGKGWYHGGDLAGLRERLDYLEDLGVTALWITPPFTNRWVAGRVRPATTATGRSTTRRSTPTSAATTRCAPSSTTPTAAA